MKYTLYIALCTALVFSACSKADPEPETKAIELIVVDERQEFVPSAIVKIYDTEEDFRLARNADPLLIQTDGKGRAYLELKEARTYFLSISALESNNWGGKTSIDNGLSPKRVVIEISASVGSKIAGRYKKRWKQLYTEIDGQRFEKCENKMLYEFIRNGPLNIYSEGSCAPGGGEFLMSNEEWRVNSLNTSIVLGPESSPEKLKHLVMLKLTETEMKYYYQIIGKDRNQTIVETFEARN